MSASCLCEHYWSHVTSNYHPVQILCTFLLGNNIVCTVSSVSTMYVLANANHLIATCNHKH
jgi:hypothetical protein